MKRLTTLLVAGVVVLVWLPVVQAAEPGPGVGWQSSSLVEGVSFKHQLGGGLALQGVLGHVSLSIDEPTIEEDGDEEDLDMTLKASAWNLGARALWTIREETNLDVYVGGGGALYLLSGEADIDDESVEMSGTGLGIHGVVGVEYRFQGLQNLAFSTEIGMCYIWLNELDVESSEGDVTIHPNASVNSFFLGGGIHYYF